MNLNHDPDKHLLDRIDKLLETHQPAGNEVLDELAATRPTPRPAFQNALEQRLLARFDQIKQGETSMVSSTSYMPIPRPRRNWLPLTLLVALIVVAIAGVMLINGRGKSPTPNEMALAAATATTQSTSTPYATVAIVPPENPYVRIPGVGSVAPVVIAVRDIPSGTVLSSQWLAVVYSGDDISQMYSDPERLRGLVTKQDIPRWQPILRNNVTDQLQSTAIPTDRPVSNAGIYPSTDSVSIAIPLASITSDSLVPGVGGAVDIVALLPFKSVNLNVSTVPATFMPDGSRIAETMLMQDTVVLYHGQWPLSNPDDKTQTITFAVSSNESRMLAWLAEQPQVTFRLQKPLTNTFDFPSDSRIESIPFENVTADENIRPGDMVDVYTTCALVPDIVGINNTVVSSKTDCTQTEEVKRVSKATVFIGEIVVSGPASVMTYQSISLAVPPDTVPIFTQMNDAKMHFKLVKSTAASLPTPTPIPAPLSQSVFDIPLNLIDSTDDPVQVGDFVDVYSTCVLVDNPPSPKVDCTQAVEQKEFFGSVVLMSGVLDRNGTPAPNTLSVTVPADMRTRMSTMLAAEMHFKLAKSTAVNQPALTPTPVPQPTDTLGKVAFDLPLASILPLAQGISLNTGTYVDLVVSFKQIDITNTAPTEFQQVVPARSAQAGSEHSQRIVHAAHVVTVGDVLTLAVSPEEAAILQWALDAKLPIKLHPVDPENTFVTPTFTINLNLDSISHWASDNLEVGDSVDVVVGLVLGYGQDLKLSFKPHGEYNWNDALTSGLISAQTYSPDNTNSPSGAMFLRRFLQNAKVTAVNRYRDPASGRTQNITITLELQSDTATTQGNALKDWVDAGMPYLVIKHWSIP